MASHGDEISHHDVVVIGAGPAAAELGTTPRRLTAGQDGLLKLGFHGSTRVLPGVRAICGIASEITGTGQAMIHSEATIEDVLRTWRHRCGAEQTHDVIRLLS